MIWFMIIMIVALALIGVPMSFSMLTGSVWFMLSSGMPQTLMIQRLFHAGRHDYERRRRGNAHL